MKIDHSIGDRWRLHDDVLTTTIPETWGQGRTTYGGLTAAYALAAAQRVEAERSLRSFSTQLFRPIRPGGLLEARPRVLRRGKYTTFVEVELAQDGPAARFQYVFGSSRSGSLRVPAVNRFIVHEPNQLTEFPYIPNVMPEFLQHFDLRWSEGSVPFSGGEAAFAGVCRHREHAAGVAGLVALLDVWPCPSLAALREPAAASTATWSAQILRVPERVDGWFGFRYRTEHGADGFHAVRGELYDETGDMLATTEQLVLLFDA